MDADWGSSSDEETAAERAAHDAEKLKETMALLEAFEKTRDPSDYGAIDGKKFRQERSQAAGRAMWEERRSRAGVEKQEEAEIKGAMKYHIIMGLIIIAVLGFALVGVYNTLGSALSAPPANSTNTTSNFQKGSALDGHPLHKAKSKGLPPLKVVLFAVFLGISIPTFCLVRRQFRANKTKSFQGHFYRGVDHG